MGEATRLDFDSFPSIVGAYGKAVIPGRPPRLPKGKSVPRIEAHIAKVTPQPAKVSRYSEVCGFERGDSLPITYPHILAAPLHMAMLTDPAFPVRLMGLVHVSNSITQHRPIPLRETLEINCAIEGHRDTDRGQEFDMNTEVRAGKELLWTEVTSFLARGRGGKRRGRRKPRDKKQRDTTGYTTTSWHVPGDIGRRYAMVSGDFNPIHLSMPTAKLLGFPRAIAHGMWTLARSFSEVTADTGVETGTLDVEFKLPVLLPTWVNLHSLDEAGNAQFILADAQGEKPHLLGTFAAAE